MSTRDYEVLKFEDAGGKFFVSAFSEWYENDELEQYVPEAYILRKKGSGLWRVAIQVEATSRQVVAERMADSIVKARFAEDAYHERLEALVAKLLAPRGRSTIGRKWGPLLGPSSRYGWFNLDADIFESLRALVPPRGVNHYIEAGGTLPGRTKERK